MAVQVVRLRLRSNEYDKEDKTRLLFIGMVVFAMILNSVVDMHPNGIPLKYIASDNISFIKTKIIINDNFNKVIMLDGITKDDINLTINKDCRLIRIINKKVELKTEKRTLGILNDNKINGIGKQLFGITKRNIQDIIVDKKGYFIEVE